MLTSHAASYSASQRSSAYTRSNITNGITGCPGTISLRLTARISTLTRPPFQLPRTMRKHMHQCIWTTMTTMRRDPHIRNIPTRMVPRAKFRICTLVPVESRGAKSATAACRIPFSSSRTLSMTIQNIAVPAPELLPPGDITPRRHMMRLRTTHGQWHSLTQTMIV